MSKTFVLDTNVILLDPFAINKFGKKNHVYIPLVVVEEIDRFKKDQNEKGRNARHFSRIIDELRGRGGLVEGVDLSCGGKLFLSINGPTEKLEKFKIDLNINDNIILSCALGLQDQGRDVTLISKDINLRLKADILAIKAEDYGQKDVSFEELYRGHQDYEISKEDFLKFEESHVLTLKTQVSFFPNEYLTLFCKENPQKKALGRFLKKENKVLPLRGLREGIWGIYPRNREQSFALDALMNEEIKLVSLVGMAGTGKTLLAIAAGLEMTIAQEKYSRLLVSRPVQPMGKDIGFLPGDVSEKLGPWMQPIFDNMDFLFGQHRVEGSASYEELINHGLLHVEPLTYIRGRTIPGQYLIVDEAQNLSPHEIKTIVTRAGEGTKIVLTGDCYQVDSPYLDEVNNGLVYALDHLKQEEIVAHILLIHGERSELSEVATQHL